MLIIYAHPNKSGHSGLILEEVIAVLNKKNHSYKILDLYEMNYNPVMHENEHYTSGGRDIAPENLEIQKLIKKNDKFVFIYPTWWNSMPAILKGFMDRVLVARFAFKFKGKFPVKLLSGKAAVFSTTGGPRVFSKFFVKDRGLKIIVKDTLRYCGIRAKGYSIGNSNKLTEKQRMKVRKMVERGMRYLLK